MGFKHLRNWTKKPSIRTYLTFSLGSLFSVAIFAQTPSSIPDFKASYDVHAYGFDLGLSEHEFRCQESDCTLTTSSHPQGWVTMFFKDSADETIQIKQDAEQFLWQGYQKESTRYKGDKPNVKLTTYQVNPESKQITYIEKDRNWAWTSGVFDNSSIAYAIQWYALNHKELNQAKLILQGPKKQYPVEFTVIDKPETLKLDFGKASSQKYRFGNDRYEIDLWLLPQWQYLPGKLRIYDREEDNKIELKLAKKPQFLDS